ncbi:MmgE/PrpD family protein [Verticiella sediminum]|uniref:MmgE/PrpD family protein n=1 Tax=Verticiella sediminum TaxID=1247510 RepID=A0A556AJF2_9BURK|nr:MmgE/PrpD family protein [Verticiella sediminum]TSH93038.1 MmgE/PrpD family protein [Verticiella sediminum]
MNTTQELARYAIETRYQDIPEPVRRAAKRLMLDTLGCAVGALGTDPGIAVRRIVQRSGAVGPASVIGTGQKTSIATAAWANGRLGNVLDMDECYKVQGHHAQAALGTALALAETHALDGRALLAAFTLGFEVGVRLGNFFSPRVTVDAEGRTRGWTGLVGPGQGVHAACTAAARLIGSSPVELAHAFGSCAQYMVGRDWSRQWGRDVDLGTLKYADTGWNAQGGLMAAWHAREGVRGVRDIFDGDSYAQVFQGVVLDPVAMLENLGRDWYLPETSIKFWPCCRWIHYALTALDAVLRRHGLQAAEIDAIDLHSFPMIPYPRFADQGDPPNLVAATFSFPHAAAMVALGVPAGPAWFTEASLGGLAAREMRRKVRLLDEERAYDPAAWGLADKVLKVPSRAVVHARGQTFSAQSDFALGDAWDGAPGFAEQDVFDKFARMVKTLAPYSPQWEARSRELIDAVMGVDDMDDVRELTRLFDPAR